ncbi:hypothetical protein E1A91_D07G098600v1 [Gossypium mustelinum]|uniref:Phorbol-ester/DAG-type domain-containing protein n=1 Tax=Gossypium mustelinum TaxID=34275 RepID=A0A5D2U804_GOSMU|nr:hypothetical protein E1A91_D07G098600v1 [Gossypium mustelinum]
MNHQSKETFRCFGCQRKVKGPSLSCSDCEFFLHKECGENVSYICSTCSIQVHKDCISLPCFIRFTQHRHHLSRNFFLSIRCHNSRIWDCRIYYKKVDMEHGSYCCSRPDCDFVIHVKCATSEASKFWYNVTEFENPNEFTELDEFENLIIPVLQEIKVGDNVYCSCCDFFLINHALNR